MLKVNNKEGFTMPELMAVTVIVLIIFGGLYASFTSGQSTILTTNDQVLLQENVRKTVERVTKELQESGSDVGGNMKFSIGDGTGENNTDIIKFSMPVMCQAGVSIINSTGDVAYWGAPLSWGCSNSSCMDADDDCSTLDYSSVQYRIDADNQLVREVLDASNAVVREDVFAQNINNFQATLSADQNIVTLVITATRDSSVSRQPVTATRSINVHLKNRG